MKSKNFTDYYVGLDIGTDSVGYAVSDSDYSLLKFRGEPMWGVTLFDAANTCDQRRYFRTARRRLDRRQQRIALLQELFSGEIAAVDPSFFQRLRESALLKADKTTPYENCLAECEWSDHQYHKNYSTIHHLIVGLMRTQEKPDIRYVYLACAWLIAHRGHFLTDIDGDRVDELTDISSLYRDFENWFIENGYDLPWSCNARELSGILSKQLHINEKEKELYALLTNGKKPKDSEDDPVSKAMMIKLLAGGSVKVKDLFIGSGFPVIAEGSLKLDNPDSIEAMLADLGEGADLVRCLAGIYDCASLARILSDSATISDRKVTEYEVHQADLKELKRLIRKYRPEMYRKIFRDAEYPGYSAYVSHFNGRKNEQAKQKRVLKDEFYKSVKAILVGIDTDAPQDRTSIDEILLRISLGTYMPKQVVSDNRVIPHQLYYSELKSILENVSRWYPFLNQTDEHGLTVTDKIKSIFNFRVPYYVGPLNPKSTYAWLERKAGKIYPWNFDEMVDKDTSEQRFINRMTNKCSYLPGEDVLPQNSLLYCQFNVLNEINPLKIDGRPVSVSLKQKLYDSLFMSHGKPYTKVTFRHIADFLICNGMIGKGEIERISGIDTEIKSSLKPYHDFDKWLSSGQLTVEDVEQIILYSTIIEDKRRLSARLSRDFRLSDADIKEILGKKYKDFGRLSSRLLNGLEGVNKTTGERGTVLHFLWNTNDNLMQILSDPNRYDFCEQIKAIKAEYYSAHPITLDKRLEEMRLSNAVKRPILRTLDVVDDIRKATGRPPKKIFIEMARGTTEEQKNQRTISRRTQLLEIFKGLHDEDARRMGQELEDLGEQADARLQSESLFLYFRQMGKCMYCGKPIEISDLGTGKYNIDHIWPRAYVKDDSILNNKVLVHSTENAEKKDCYPLPAGWRTAMHGFWSCLHTNGLINDEKFKRLTRNTTFTAEEKTGFINRQLVETRQSTKAVAELLKERFPDTEIVYVKAGNVSEFRHQYGEIRNRAFHLHLTDQEKREAQLIKCRSVNDTHHANDAYLNIVVGNLYHERFSSSLFHADTDTYSLNYDTLFGCCFARKPEVWDPKKHLPIVDRVMANPHIHLTKYQTRQKGGFFNQNPTVAGNKDLKPRKAGLDPVRYGGYNKVTASFFTLISYLNGKKKELTILPVELLVADRFVSDEAFAFDYVREKLGEKARDLSFPLQNRILKINTVFSLDGFDVCLSGKSTGGVTLLMRSLATLYLPRDMTAYIKCIERVSEKLKQNKDYPISSRFDRVSTEENLRLYDFLAEKITGKWYRKLPGANPNLGEKERSAFINCDIREQLRCLENLILFLKTNRAGACDLLSVGRNKTTGSTVISANISNWKYSDIRIVDRSASGLFESRSFNLKDLL